MATRRHVLHAGQPLLGSTSRHAALSPTHTSLCLYMSAVINSTVQRRPCQFWPGSIIKPDHRELRVGSLNAWFVINKTELIHNAIDEKKLDISAVMETFIRADHPSAIKHDPAPPGYSICHKHRQSASESIGGGIALIQNNRYGLPILHVQGILIVRSVTRAVTTSTGRLNFLIVYRPPQSQGFYDEFRDFVTKLLPCPAILTSVVISTAHLKQLSP